MPETSKSETMLADRSVIRVSATDPADDAREFLQGLVTQDMKRVLPGAPQWAGLLSAQGKALFDFILWADGADVGGDILIDCEAAWADDLVKRLSLYRLRRKIAIARDDALAVHWAMPEQKLRRPREGGGRIRSSATASSPRLRGDDEEGYEALDPRLAALGWRWLSHSRHSVGNDTAYRAHRLSLGVTEGRVELGYDQTLWLECNASELNGVAFDKGCYVGQENTARMNWRQKINRRMVVVPLAEVNPKRQRVAYPELALSVEHRRVEDLAGLALPEWLRLDPHPPNLRSG